MLASVPKIEVVALLEPRAAFGTAGLAGMEKLKIFTPAFAALPFHRREPGRSIGRRLRRQDIEEILAVQADHCLHLPAKSMILPPRYRGLIATGGIGTFVVETEAHRFRLKS